MYVSMFTYVYIYIYTSFFFFVGGNGWKSGTLLCSSESGRSDRQSTWKHTKNIFRIIVLPSWMVYHIHVKRASRLNSQFHEFWGPTRHVLINSGKVWIKCSNVVAYGSNKKRENTRKSHQEDAEQWRNMTLMETWRLPMSKKIRQTSLICLLSPPKHHHF